MAKLGKLITYILIGLSVISVILLISLMANSSSNPADPRMNSWLNNNIYWVYFLFVVLCCLALGFAIIQTVTDKRAAKRGLLVIGGFVVIGVVSYLLSSDKMPQFLGVETFIDSGQLTLRISKLIDTGFYITYFLFIVAILSLALSPLLKYFEK
jgi:hypothetical protein